MTSDVAEPVAFELTLLLQLRISYVPSFQITVDASHEQGHVWRCQFGIVPVIVVAHSARCVGTAVPPPLLQPLQPHPLCGRNNAIRQSFHCPSALSRTSSLSLSRFSVVLGIVELKHTCGGASLRIDVASCPRTASTAAGPGPVMLPATLLPRCCGSGGGACCCGGWPAGSRIPPFARKAVCWAAVAAALPSGALACWPP